MAVSKIAVMALVGILAVPILLGYALNLNETSVTDYKPDGESVNVTGLLENGSLYGYVSADSYSTNANFVDDKGLRIMPLYNTYSLNTTSLPMLCWHYTPDGQPSSTTTYWESNISTYAYISNVIVENLGTGYVDFDIVDNDDSSVYTTIHKIRSFYWENSSSTFSYEYYLDSTLTTYDIDSITLPDSNYKYVPHTYGDFNMERYLQRAKLPQYADVEPWNYADLSDGYYFNTKWNGVAIPDNTRSVLLTINLDSIPDNTYSFSLLFGNVSLTFNKNWVGDRPQWNVLSTSFETIHNLYYDPSRSDNTYQIYFSSLPYEKYDGQYYNYTYTNHLEIRYVGGWPTVIGSANTYMKYTYDFTNQRTTTTPHNGGIYQLFYHQNQNIKSLTMRVDDVNCLGITNPAIVDNTYKPSDFKNNPTTTITNISYYGASIEFGGNTYTVDNTGNITLGTHKVSVNGLKLESIPVPVGYENRINGNVISVTAEPSTIKFNGQWGASVSTIANSATTYTKTEWIPGEFAWDGIDTNFLIVGLITCIGVFIALGIYVRKSGKGMIPLILVCGGAITLFICMI